jgi:hypothetical protein
MARESRVTEGRIQRTEPERSEAGGANLDLAVQPHVDRRTVDPECRREPTILSRIRVVLNGRPGAFAVRTLMTSSNFRGCSTVRSPGRAPLRIRST